MTFKKIKLYFLILLFFLQLYLTVLARPSYSQKPDLKTYYISPLGNDTNIGTLLDQPWKSIDKINSVTFKAGDRILFQGGATFSGNLSFDANDQGTTASPITISSYGTGQATINAGTGTGILVYNAGGYQISNLKIVGAGVATNTGNGINFYTDLSNNNKLEYIKIDTIEVSGFQDSGLRIGSWNQASGYRNVSITNSLIHDNGSGLSTYAQLPDTNENVYVGYIQAYNNLGRAEVDSPIGNGIVLGESTSARPKLL